MNLDRYLNYLAFTMQITIALSKSDKMNVRDVTTVENEAIISAYKDTFKYCYNNFINERWNCPVPESIKDAKNPVSLTFAYPQATKETAYVFALMSASIMFHIISTCQMGTEARMCKCVRWEAANGYPGVRREAANGYPGVRREAANGYPGVRRESANGYSGVECYTCKEKSMVALKRTKQILKIFDYRFEQVEKRKIFNWNNFQAGLEVYNRLLRRKCKCHGTSGQCTLKTCWESPSTLERTSFELKVLYEKAQKFSIEMEDRQKQLSVARDRTARIAKLIYLIDSPDYCKTNKKLGILGTLNRKCSHSNDDSCQKLCSSCGYRKHSYVTTTLNKNCNCTFVWCCNLHCKKCEVNEISAKCKLPT